MTFPVSIFALLFSWMIKRKHRESMTVHHLGFACFPCLSQRTFERTEDCVCEISLNSIKLKGEFFKGSTAVFSLKYNCYLIFKTISGIRE